MSARRQFLLFSTVGAANSILGLTVIYALKLSLGATDLVANAAGYAVGMTASFLLNKTVTFAHSGGFTGTALRFIIIQLLAYLSNLTTVLLLIHAGANSYFGQAMGIIPYTTVGFLGAKFFVFTSVSSTKSGLHP